MRQHCGMWRGCIKPTSSRGTSGRLCCSPKNDCRVVRARLLTQDAESVTAEVEGSVVRLPARSVHPSQDTQDWVCETMRQRVISEETIRCLFIAAGS